MKKIFFISLAISIFYVALPLKSFSKDWITNITIKGGSLGADSNLYYNYVYHHVDYQNSKESIKCKGRGNESCPNLIHTAGIIMKKSIEAKVNVGIEKGMIINKELYAVAFYSEGKVKSDGLLEYEATIHIFDSSDELTEYLSSIGH